jgi:hypothetical protein
MNTVPTLSRVLGLDFIGMIQRTDRYNLLPSSNNLDVAVDYIPRTRVNDTEPATGCKSEKHQQDRDTLSPIE